MSKRSRSADFITFTYRSQDATRLFLGLVGLDVFFAVAYVFMFVWPGIPPEPHVARNLFNLDGEWTLPTWFATVQLFSVGAVLLLAAWRSNRENRFPSIVLGLGGLLFLFLSADEGGGIHERIAQVIRTEELEPLLFLGGWGSWIPVYALVGLVLSIVTGVYLRKPLWRAWQRFPRLSLIVLGGFATIVAGGVGVEVIWLLFLVGEQGTHLAIAVEEFLEMVGASIILYATIEIGAALCSQKPT
jgi:hypothetical protein